jgi:hypothetical protein
LMTAGNPTATSLGDSTYNPVKVSGVNSVAAVSFFIRF